MAAIKFETPVVLDEQNLLLEVPLESRYAEPIKRLVEDSRKRGDGKISFEITRPHRVQNKKPRGQNRRFRGHCRDIAEQITDEDGNRIHSPEQVAEAMKRLAVEEGYPWRVSLDGITEPKSTSEATVEEMQILLETQVRFADEHQLWLTEYDEHGREYKSVAGEPVYAYR